MLVGDEFNTAILEAVTTVNANWAGRGYDINCYFTHDLQYGPDCCVPANHAPKTMCVAAVTEVLITALTAYFVATNDTSPFQKLPLKSWRGGTRKDIRPYIFMYDGLGSNGTADALERFGIGRQVGFAELMPGGVINFNRTSGSGHSCVFLSYIDKSGDDVGSFGSSVVGYRYFSAQGKGLPDAGFGFRWAFFDGSCPTSLPSGRRRDCGVIRSDDPKFFCCGHMISPAKWPATVGIAGHKIQTEAAVELPMPDLSRFDGITTD